MVASWLAVLASDLALAQMDVPAGRGPGACSAGATRSRVHCYAGWTRHLRPLAANTLVGSAGEGGCNCCSRSLCDWYWQPHSARPSPGVLTPFPIALSVVCAFTAAQAGHPGVLALLRGIVPGLDGFALFCFLVAVMINKVGAAVAFGVATVAAVIFAISPSCPNPKPVRWSAATIDERLVSGARSSHQSVARVKGDRDG